MKKYIQLALLTLLCQAASGQASNDVAPDIRYFEVEGKTYYEVLGCIPGSDIAFYSEPQGGRRLKTLTTDANGHILLEAEKNFRPAFLLSIEKKNKDGIAGNGKVAFAGDRDFLLENIKLTGNDNLRNIQWSGAVKSPEDFFFRVHKSTDGINYEVLEEVHDISVEVSPYSVADIGHNMYYKIELVNKHGKTSFITHPIAVNGQANVLIYPTQFTDALQVKLPHEHTTGQYIINNVSGQVVDKGSLSAGKNNLQLRSLPAGSYFISILSNNTVIATGKVSKL